MLKRLDRYIIKKFFKTFGSILLMTTIIVVLIDYTEKNDDFIKYKLSFQEILQYFISFIPFIINMTMPIIVFLTTVFVTSQLAKHTEIIAILSSGIHFMRLLWPYIICALSIALFSFVLNGWILGKANKFRIAFETTYITVRDNKNNTARHLQIDPQTYMYVQYYDTTSQTGKGITVEKIIDHRLIERTTAAYMQWHTTTNHWSIHNWQKCQLHTPKLSIEQGDILDLYDWNITPEDFQNDFRLNEALTLTELNTYIKRLQSRGTDNIQVFLVEKYIKYMAPFSVIILTIIGFLTACSKTRGGVAKKLALGGVLATVYIALFLFTKVLAEMSTGYTLLTIWTPNLVYTILLILFYRMTPK